MKRFAKVAVLGVIVLAMASCAPKKAPSFGLTYEDGVRVMGKVYDEATNKPLNANVVVPIVPLNIKTDADGSYLIRNLPAGKYRAVFSAWGYEPKTVDIVVKDGEITKLDVGLSKIEATVSGVLYDGKTHKPISGTVEVDPDGMVVTATNGKYTLSLPFGVYMLKARAEKHIFDVKTVVINDAKPKKVNFVLARAAGGESFATKFPVIYFDFDSYRIKNEYKGALDRVADLLKANPGLVVEVAGHASSEGSFEYNAALSLKRALAVRDYLIKKGVSPERLIPRGYSESRVADFNYRISQRKKNRRVEFIVR